MPEPDEYRSAFARLDRPARGRVIRAVNLVRPLDDPHEAALVVAAANAQRRFWRRWWVGGPLLAGALRYPDGWEAVLASALLATLMFAGLGLFFSRRASRSAALNQTVVDAAGNRRKSSRKPSKKSSKPRKARRHR